MQESYVQVFLKSAVAAGDLNSALTVLFLFLARMLPIIAQSPFFGAKVLPNPTKVFFAITLFIIFLPQMLLTMKTAPKFDSMLFLLMGKELFIGFAIGMIVSIPFVIVQTSGILIDHQRGGASLMVNDPTIQNQSSPVGLLYNMVMIVIFYMINGPFLFMNAIADSYQLIPPDQFINPTVFNYDSPLWQQMVKLFNQVMVIAIQLSAPALIAILMTDVFLGIANRLAPQVQITFLGMPLKSLLGLAVVAFGWLLLTTEFVRQGYLWVNNVVTMIELFAYK